MALTILDVDAGPPSPVIGAATPYGDVVKQVTFDSSYATGGESLTPAMLGLTSIVFLDPNAAGGYFFVYDYANQKLLAYLSGSANAVLAEVASTTDLSAIATRIYARGARA